MHVRNEQEPRILVELNKPYIVVGRVDDRNKKSYMWVWDVKANAWKGRQVRTSAGIPSGGNEVITIGRATTKAHEWLQGELAAYTMWNSFLSDAEVVKVVAQYAKNMGQGNQATSGNIYRISRNIYR